MKLLPLLLSAIFLTGCATNNGTDSDEIVGELKEAGHKVGGGIKKGANAVEESICDTFSKDPDSCKE